MTQESQKKGKQGENPRRRREIERTREPEAQKIIKAN
jgi:hypothetical protein